MTAEHDGPPGRQTGHEIHFQDKKESKFESDVGFDKECASGNNPFVPKKASLQTRESRESLFQAPPERQSSGPNWLTFSLTV